MCAILYEPPQFENREFAIIKQGKDVTMWRHLSFKNVDKLRAFLIEQAPKHVYFSAAKYEYPELTPMQTKKKYWLGSDLIFDIDFDKLKVQSLEEALRHITKLKRILDKDFGLKKITVVFSGSRGYHIHVRDACIQQLNNEARREIVDYFCEFMPWKEKENNDKYVGLDAPVTCDVARLIRLPGTLHGGSGKRCEVITIDSPQFNKRANIFLKGRK